MIFIGIDPGASGGMVALDDMIEREDKDGGTLLLPKYTAMPDTEEGIWKWLLQYAYLEKPPKGTSGVTAVIEKIPPAIFGTAKGSNAKLYGSYMALRAFLTAAVIPFEAVTAATWHKGLGIVPRGKAEEKTAWKNRLKKEARKRFQGIPMTLDTCDAYLIAYYAQQQWNKSKE